MSLKVSLSAMSDISRVHFVGIGGAGMSGIAEVLQNLGFQVSGSDLQKSSVTEHLESQGIQIQIGHQEGNVKDVDVIVYSTAIPEDNPELRVARVRNIPVVSRAMMLGELMRFRNGVAVSGTHGKTTTTSLISHAMAEGGLDPTFVVGGKLNHYGTNAKLGSGQYFVAEADESDASFLHLNPISVVLTNIDADHMETYQGDFNVLTDTFLRFIHRIPFYGKVYVCLDDPINQTILEKIERPLLTYGFHEDALYRVIDYKQVGLSSHFTITHPSFHAPVACRLHLPGAHNVLNATAALAVCHQAGMTEEQLSKALGSFGGINRRFQYFGEYRSPKGVFGVVDDYGHHPNEIKHTIQTAKDVWPDKRLMMVFQPHRYSRTKDLFNDFVDVLAGVDELLLLDVYSAGEKEIPEVNSKALASEIKSKFNTELTYITQENALPELLKTHLQRNDLLLMQGAGNINMLTKGITQAFERVE